MARLGTVKPASGEPAATAAAETVARSERIEARSAEVERRSGASATDHAAAPGKAGARYRRVFACATGAADSPDEPRGSVARAGAE